mmetsp:Transcript_12006/g.28662  ORF Transcript_12006/g.28662 Transcript_12006/m.28662 type:complete len:145 (+) Transcript_12006:71-505(+)
MAPVLQAPPSRWGGDVTTPKMPKMKKACADMPSLSVPRQTLAGNNYLCFSESQALTESRRPDWHALEAMPICVKIPAARVSPDKVPVRAHSAIHRREDKVAATASTVSCGLADGCATLRHGLGSSTCASRRPQLHTGHFPADPI